MTSSLLLDTRAALWVLADAQLSPEAVAAIDDATDDGGRVFVSPITAWEIGNLAARSRFTSSYSPQRWLALLLATPQIALADMPPHVLMESTQLPGVLNRDPADRILAATAREYGFTIVTRDADLLRYAGEGFISALKC
jgi:PIN domain nuclease of toxin-antitoxin system